MSQKCIFTIMSMNFIPIYLNSSMPGGQYFIYTIYVYISLKISKFCQAHSTVFQSVLDTVGNKCISTLININLKVNSLIIQLQKSLHSNLNIIWNQKTEWVHLGYICKWGRQRWANNTRSGDGHCSAPHTNTV